MSFPIGGPSAPGIFTTPIDGGSTPIAPIQPAQENDGPGFAELVGNALDKVNASQAQADTAVQKFMTGEQTEIHQVMLQMEQARLSMMMAVEVRNKSVEAYQEISRMPL
jgi:flagellar hook-basal body complex protein FliE